MSPILLLTGITATIGIFLGGRLADRRPNETLRYSYPLMALLYLLAYFLAPTSLWVGLALATVLVFPLTLVATTVQNRVLIGARAAPDLASTLISSVFNVGTAFGSFVAASSLNAGMSYRNCRSSQSELPLPRRSRIHRDRDRPEDTAAGGGLALGRN